MKETEILPGPDFHFAEVKNRLRERRPGIPGSDPLEKQMAIGPIEPSKVRLLGLSYGISHE